MRNLLRTAALALMWLFIIVCVLAGLAVIALLGSAVFGAWFGVPYVTLVAVLVIVNMRAATLSVRR